MQRLQAGCRRAAFSRASARQPACSTHLPSCTASTRAPVGLRQQHGNQIQGIVWHGQDGSSRAAARRARCHGQWSWLRSRRQRGRGSTGQRGGGGGGGGGAVAAAAAAAAAAGNRPELARRTGNLPHPGTLGSSFPVTASAWSLSPRCGSKSWAQKDRTVSAGCPSLDS